MDRLWLVYVAFLVATTAVGRCRGGQGQIQPLRTWHVKVVNRMSHGEDVTVSCKSGDDNIGLHKLRPGEFISWKFKIDIATSTLFFCNAWHGTHPRFRVVFDAFRASDPAFEWLLCVHGSNWCIWELHDDGLWTSSIDQLYRPWHRVRSQAEAPEIVPFLDM